MLNKDLAICIRAVDYSETSQIITFFTRTFGKLNAIAKGSKRPKSAFGGPIEIFSCGNIVFSDSNKEKLATLTELEQSASFTQIANNLFTYNCCLFAAELINHLTSDYDRHSELFDSFLQFLNNAQHSNDEQRMLILLILFQLGLLAEVGLKPTLDCCVNCKSHFTSHNTQYEVYFSSSANGLICRDCQGSFPDRTRLTQSAADCLSSLKSIADVNKKTLMEIEKLLIRHFTEILGKQPKLAKYLWKYLH
jgi:DNA repair protein RecO (recombination protein O)